jgi:hypothetical protein
MNRLKTVGELISLCNRYCPERFQMAAVSFLDFGVLAGPIGQGTFAFESETFPSVIYREQQNLFHCTADSHDDSAHLHWDFWGGAHEFAASNIPDLVISAVLDDLTLAWTMGFSLDEPERPPDHIDMLWVGQSISRNEIPSWCGEAEGRLWFNIPHQGGLFCLG